MIKKLLSYLKEPSKRILDDLKRIWPLLVAILIPIVIFAEAPQITSISIALSMTLFVLVVIHIGRQWLFPYLDLKLFILKALESPTASALVFIAMLIFTMFIVYVAVAKAECYDQKMIRKATPYIPELKNTFNKHWPNAPLRYFEGGKIEQESSWNRFAELHTSREWGVSFSQITIAYNSNGTIRFDNFQNAKKRYKELQGWEWKDRFNVKMNFIFIVLEDRRNFMVMKSYFMNDINRWAALMVAYNAGSGTVWKRKALCKTTNGCNPTVWFGGLNTVRMSFEDKLLYGRPLWKARNEYPEKIIFQRAPKYKGII